MLAFVLAGMMTTDFDPVVLTAHEHIWTQEEVRALAISEAEVNGLHVGHFLAVLECENNFNAKGQSKHINSKGEQEQSFGAAQIHLLAHKDVTQAQAEDPNFAIPWMAKEWAKGNHRMWSCWDILNERGW